MRYPKHAVFMCFVMGILMGGCGPTQRSLKSKKQSIATKKIAIRSAKSALEASDTYAEFLKSKRGTYWAVSKTQLTQLMNAYLPYPFKEKNTLIESAYRGSLSFTRRGTSEFILTIASRSDCRSQRRM